MDNEEIDYKVGDKVRVKDIYKENISKWYGQELTVTLIRDGWTTFESKDGKHDSYFAHRFEKLSSRVEGQKINVRDVKKGDEILVTWDSRGMTSTRQGVVSDILHVTDWGQDNWILYVPCGTVGKQRLYASEANPEVTLTLVKAAPKVDHVLEKLKAVEVGTVFVVPDKNQTIGRKTAAGRWEIFYVDGKTTAESEDVAKNLSISTRLREKFDEVRWLS